MTIGPAAEGARAGKPSVAAPIVLFAVLAVTIPAAGALSYGAAASGLRSQKERELTTIAALKVNELERWRTERLVAADGIAASPELARLAPAGSAAVAVRDVERWFETLREVAGHEALALLGPSGDRIAGTVPAVFDAEDVAVVRRALAERRTLVSDVHGHPAPHVLVVAPVPGTAGGSARAAVAAWADARRALEHLALSWPSPGPRAETPLVQRDGDRAVGVAGTGLLDPVLLARREDPLARAAAGERGVFPGVDQRGRQVLAAVEPVPQTGWSVVAQVEAGEALAPPAGLRRGVIAGVLALLAAAAAGTSLWWRGQRDAFERRLVRDEVERLALARRVEQLTRFARDMVFLTDEDHRIVEANDRAVATLGYSREELLGMRIEELRDPATLADFLLRCAQEQERATLFETRYRRKDGTTFPVEVSAHSDVVDGRRSYHGIARDITERKHAEEAMHTSEAKFRAAFEFASLGILLVDAAGHIVETNRAIRRMLDRSEEALRALSFEEIHAAPDRASAAAILRQMREGAVGAVELPRRLRRADGCVAEVILRASALRDEGGAFRFALAVVEDVTDKRRLEAQLMLADRMASVGTLAAGVAHEINNPLAFILANLEFALGELRAPPTDPEVLRALSDAHDGGLRVREIVRDLKAFSRADAATREEVDVRTVLQSAIGLAQNEIRHRARIEVDVDDVPGVIASEHRLGQVFLNLLINAAQAIPEGDAARNLVHARVGTAPDGRVLVEISDTGAGIPPEVLPRIFDPFFTTKPVGVGTGLGLSICHGIVTASGGEIQVESSPGSGSTFRVLLPAGDRPRAAPPPPPAPPSPPRRGRVLVVDDEPLVGRAVSRILSQRHDVTVLTSGRDAVAQVARGGFDVVLCDLMMPEMSGMEVHARLRELDPGLAARTVFLTGGAFTAGARAFLDEVRNPRVQKPFDPEALRTAVDHALGLPHGSARARAAT